MPYMLEDTNSTLTLYETAYAAVSEFYAEVIRLRQTALEESGFDSDVEEEWKEPRSRARHLLLRSQDWGYRIDEPIVFELPDGGELTLEWVDACPKCGSAGCAGHTYKPSGARDQKGGSR